MSAQAKPQLAIATPSDCEIVMTRVMRAPRALVFDAFTKPEMIKRWLLGPDGWSMPVCDVDLRVGGTFHYVWHNDSDDNEFGLHGAYREIMPHERIVHAETSISRGIRATSSLRRPSPTPTALRPLR